MIDFVLPSGADGFGELGAAMRRQHRIPDGTCWVQKIICSPNESQNAFEFAPFADAGMLSPMNSSCELKKLGHKACPSQVRDVLRRHGLPPAPGRKGTSWKQFIQAHLEVTWATDFFTEEVWTLGHAPFTPN